MLSCAKTQNMTTELETDWSRFIFSAKSIFYFEIPLTLKLLQLFNVTKFSHLVFGCISSIFHAFKMYFPTLNDLKQSVTLKATSLSEPQTDSLHDSDVITLWNKHTAQGANDWKQSAGTERPSGQHYHHCKDALEDILSPFICTYVTLFIQEGTGVSTQQLLTQISKADISAIDSKVKSFKGQFISELAWRAASSRSDCFGARSVVNSKR